MTCFCWLTEKELEETSSVTTWMSKAESNVFSEGTVLWLWLCSAVSRAEGNVELPVRASAGLLLLAKAVSALAPSRPR